MSDAPPTFPPAVATTIDWLQRTFGRYYEAHPPAMPDRFTRREFGFILWPDKPGPPPFIRHRAYGDAARFHNYLGWKGPHSCYYSTAYYRRPGEMKMAEKEWLGAELIFDLDADHLMQAEAAKAAGRELSLEEQLRLVKVKFQTLLDEYLLGDFGIDEKDIWITFSGGRGYHAHVTDPRLMALDSKGRREIVDYVTGKIPTERGTETPDLSNFIWKKGVDSQRFGTQTRVTYSLHTHPANAPGWRGRMTRTLVETLRERVLDADPVEAKKWLTDLEGVGTKSAESFLEKFSEAKLRHIEAGRLDQGKVIKNVIQHALHQYTIPLAKGETDEPVTSDVKRLIRLPDSLHGKSGLRVVRMELDELADFDPFRDAVALPSDAVRFTPRNDNTLTMGGETVRVAAGVETEVPIRHAVFWAARQQGTVIL